MLLKELRIFLRYRNGSLHIMHPSVSSAATTIRPYHHASRTRSMIIPYLSAIALITTSLLGYYTCRISGSFRWSSSLSADISPYPFRILVGAACRPNYKRTSFLMYNPMRPCGDDAYIVAHHEGRVLLAVADGVGGSRELGADPGKYAWRLLTGIAEMFVREKSFKAQHVLAETYEQVIETMEHLEASSTICLVEIEQKKGIMQIHNIGDSGCRVIRDGKIIYRSLVGQYDFNFPYQLQVIDPKQCVSVKQFAQGEITRYTHSQSFLLKPGDYVIIATDGVFDNIYDDRLIAWIQNHSELDIQTMATQLVSHIKQESERKDSQSPFSQAAQEKKLNWEGG
jgi:serine/threonine protein phosphatase PrpC